MKNAIVQIEGEIITMEVEGETLYGADEVLLLHSLILLPCSLPRIHNVQLLLLVLDSSEETKPR